MPTRKLSDQELRAVNSLLGDVRSSIERLSGSDPNLLFAIRRKIAKELTYDERGKPMVRKVLKARMFGAQRGLCDVCKKPLEARGKNAVLDRIETMKAYVDENTRLICSDCDKRIQEERRYEG